MIYENDIYWALACTLIPLVIEVIYVMIKRHGAEWKLWYVMSQLLYFCCTNHKCCVLQRSALLHFRNAVSKPKFPAMLCKILVYYPSSPVILNVLSTCIVASTLL